MAFVARRVKNAKRKSIYLGKDARTRPAADEVCTHIDAIVYAIENEELGTHIPELAGVPINGPAEGRPPH